MAVLTGSKVLLHRLHDLGMSLFSSALSRTATASFPLTTTAFKFLEPITAPTPARPAARPLSFMIDENKTRFSPAGPIQATLALGSVSVII
jgi:hypothetical protein